MTDNLPNQTAFLDECREVLKAKYDQDYEPRIAPYKNLLAEVMFNFSYDEFQALERILQSQELDGDNYEKMHYRAACIDLLEPDKR